VNEELPAEIQKFAKSKLSIQKHVAKINQSLPKNGRTKMIYS